MAQPPAGDTLGRQGGSGRIPGCPRNFASRRARHADAGPAGRSACPRTTGKLGPEVRIRHSASPPFANHRHARRHDHERNAPHVSPPGTALSPLDPGAGDSAGDDFAWFGMLSFPWTITDRPPAALLVTTDPLHNKILQDHCIAVRHEIIRRSLGNVATSLVESRIPEVCTLSRQGLPAAEVGNAPHREQRQNAVPTIHQQAASGAFPLQCCSLSPLRPWTSWICPPRWLQRSPARGRTRTASRPGARSASRRARRRRRSR